MLARYRLFLSSSPAPYSCSVALGDMWGGYPIFLSCGASYGFSPGASSQDSVSGPLRLDFCRALQGFRAAAFLPYRSHAHGLPSIGPDRGKNPRLRALWQFFGFFGVRGFSSPVSFGWFLRWGVLFLDRRVSSPLSRSRHSTFSYPVLSVGE